MIGNTLRRGTGRGPTRDFFYFWWGLRFGKQNLAGVAGFVVTCRRPLGAKRDQRNGERVREKERASVFEIGGEGILSHVRARG